MSIITTVAVEAASARIGSTFAQHASTESSKPSWVSFTETIASSSGAAAAAASSAR